MIIGDGNNYTRFGGIVAGLANMISGNDASVSGGGGNTASALRASISGGQSITQSSTSGWSAGGNGGAGVFHSP